MPIEIKRLIQSKRRSIALIIERDGSLVVRAPLKSSDQSIMEFVEQNRPWIEKKQSEALTHHLPEIPHYQPGEVFFYLGEAYPLEVVNGQQQGLIWDGSFKLASSVQSDAEKLFQAWYRRQARKIIRKRVKFFAETYEFQFEKMRITSARTRWGSCSATGSLSFSWRLIAAPMEVIDYVVVHELVHTVFHNHSKRFWRKVGSILPNYADLKKWLNKNSNKAIP